MALTPKKERFAQCIADGKSQADAYRDAFNVREGTKPETIQANASRLMANSEVSARVAELREMLTEKALWTRVDSVRTLAVIARGEDPEAKTADKINAVKAINAMHGWDKQVIDHTSSDGSLKPSSVNSELVKALVDKLVD